MKREYDAYKALKHESIAKKIERINSAPGLSYKMRLAAIQAVSNSTAKEKVW